jgi:hypothetical protein
MWKMKKVFKVSEFANSSSEESVMKKISMVAVFLMACLAVVAGCASSKNLAKGEPGVAFQPPEKVEAVSEWVPECPKDEYCATVHAAVTPTFSAPDAIEMAKSQAVGELARKLNGAAYEILCYGKDKKALLTGEMVGFDTVCKFGEQFGEIITRGQVQIQRPKQGWIVDGYAYAMAIVPVDSVVGTYTNRIKVMGVQDELKIEEFKNQMRSRADELRQVQKKNQQ